MTLEQSLLVGYVQHSVGWLDNFLVGEHCALNTSFGGKRGDFQKMKLQSHRGQLGTNKKENVFFLFCCVRYFVWQLLLLGQD